MNCPKCKIALVKLGHVECTTGNCDKMGCPRCRGIWFEATEYRADRMTPLKITLGRLGRLGEQDTQPNAEREWRAPAAVAGILAAENKRNGNNGTYGTNGQLAGTPAIA